VVLGLLEDGVVVAAAADLSTTVFSCVAIDFLLRSVKKTNQKTEKSDKK
jgi:hypothetical protein